MLAMLMLLELKKVDIAKFTVKNCLSIKQKKKNFAAFGG